MRGAILGAKWGLFAIILISVIYIILVSYNTLIYTKRVQIHPQPIIITGADTSYYKQPVLVGSLEHEARQAVINKYQEL